MSDLTIEDVETIKRLLTDVANHVRSWLPAPLEPAQGSEASSELRNSEQGQGKPWGEEPLLLAYAAAHMFVFAAAEGIGALADTLSLDTTAYVPHVLARAVMEAGAQAWWLLEPGIGARRRVIRSVLIRAGSARYLEQAAIEIDPTIKASAYGEDLARVETYAQGLGLELKYTGQRKQTPKCETETLPGYTKRATDFQKAVFLGGAYSIYSGAAHAELYALELSWRQSPTAAPLLERSHERIPIWTAVYSALGFAAVPVSRAIELFGMEAQKVDWNSAMQKITQTVTDVGLTSA